MAAQSKQVLHGGKLVLTLLSKVLVMLGTFCLHLMRDFSFSARQRLQGAWQLQRSVSSGSCATDRMLADFMNRHHRPAGASCFR